MGMVSILFYVAWRVTRPLGWGCGAYDARWNVMSLSEVAGDFGYTLMNSLGCRDALEAAEAWNHIQVCWSQGLRLETLPRPAALGLGSGTDSNF